jgi:hypothetical protein
MIKSDFKKISIWSSNLFYFYDGKRNILWEKTTKMSSKLLDKFKNKDSGNYEFFSTTHNNYIWIGIL